MDSLIKHRVDAILTEVQNLEEIGGTDTTDQYTEILETVRKDIESRLAAVRSIRESIERIKKQS